MDNDMLRLWDRSEPYASDGAYLDHEFQWLRTRVSRIVLKKELDACMAEDDPTPRRLGRPARAAAGELRRLVAASKEREDRLRAEIDRRLAIRRKSGAPELGLDRLSREHALSGEERLILVALSGTAMGRDAADAVYGAMPDYYSRLSICNLIALLDPKGIDDRMRYRRLFRADAPMRQANLIVLGHLGNEVRPDSLPTSEVSLSMPAFSVLTGDPGVLTEDPVVPGALHPDLFGMN